LEVRLHPRAAWPAAHRLARDGLGAFRLGCKPALLDESTFSSFRASQVI